MVHPANQAQRSARPSGRQEEDDPRRMRTPYAAGTSYSNRVSSQGRHAQPDKRKPAAARRWESLLLRWCAAIFLLSAELVVFPIAAMHAVAPVAAGQTECAQASELDPAQPASRVDGACDVILGRWASYRDAEYGIAFAYPRLWNDEGFEHCQVRRDQSGLLVGSRIEVAVVPAPDRTLDEWVEEFIAERTAAPYDWRVEAVGYRMVGDQAARGISVDYRFGGLNRSGTATFVARGARIYGLGFTAGGSACDAPAQGLTEIAAYQEMLASLEFLDESSASTAQIVPLQVGPETEVPDGIALIVETGCTQCVGQRKGWCGSTATCAARSGWKRSLAGAGRAI